MKIAVLDYHHKDKNIAETNKIVRRLIKAGASLNGSDIYRIFNGDYPNVDDYDGFVLSGSDKDNLLKRADARRSINIVEKADSLDKKVLAFCGGFELIAVVYGFKYEEMPLEKRESGWYKIKLTENGRNDQMFIGVPEKYVIFQRHKKIITDVDKDKILARNNYIQAIRFSKNIAGMQGHPEDKFIEAEEYINRYGRLNDFIPDSSDFVLNNYDIIFENFINMID